MPAPEGVAFRGLTLRGVPALECRSDAPETPFPAADSAEILLDDAVRLAHRAGAAGTAVQLEIWRFAFMLREGHDAIEAAGRFLRTHLSRGLPK